MQANYLPCTQGSVLNGLSQKPAGARASMLRTTLITAAPQPKAPRRGLNSEEVEVKAKPDDASRGSRCETSALQLSQLR